MDAKSTADINSVEYRLYTDEEKIMEGAVEVTEESIFVEESRAAENGVYDSRMGTTSHGYKCGKCNLDYLSCPGHPGYIRLNHPLKVPLTSDKIVKWLNIVCSSCGLTLIKGNILGEYPLETRFSQAWDLTLRELSNGEIPCTRCKTINYWHAFNPDTKKIVRVDTHDELSNVDIKAILSRIQDQVVLFFGWELAFHPKLFVTSILRVAPNNVRPEARKIHGTISRTDEITKIYQCMVQLNNKAEMTEDVIDNMEALYHHLVLGKPDSKDSAIENIMGKPLKTFLTIIDGKEGILRGKLQGKKLDKVTRSPVVGGSNIMPGWVTISKEAATTIDVRVKVTHRNLETMMGYFFNGTNYYPGARRIERNGAIKEINRFRSYDKLRPGDYLYRNLIDGDICLFTRQPCIWWSNISAHRIHVVEGEWTFRFNEMECLYYNADFDGDEMNIHIVEDVMAQIEAKYLSHIYNWSVSWISGGCMLGLMQDAVLGIGLLTRSCVKLSQRAVVRIFDQTNISPEFTKKMYSGRDVITLLLQTYGTFISYSRKSGWFKAEYKDIKYDEDDKFVSIIGGVHKTGVLDKTSTEQDNFGSIFHIIYNEYGLQIANEMAYDMQQMGHEYLSLLGFTIGIDDMVLPKKELTELQDSLSDVIRNSKAIHKDYLFDRLITPINKSKKDHYEEMQMAALQLGGSFLKSMISNIDPNNSYLLMYLTGSKGNLLLYQNTAVVRGQTNLDGVRMPKNVAGRTSIASTRQSYNPLDRGFITSPLTLGVTPHESLYDAEEDRVGVIKKSRSTAHTGYLSRKNIKSWESLVIDNKLSLISNATLLTPLYGGDGLDVRRLVINHVDCVSWPDSRMREEMLCGFGHIDKIYHNETVAGFLNDEFEVIMAARERYRSIFIPIESLMEMYKFGGSIRGAVDIKRILLNRQSKPGRLDPVAAIQAINNMLVDVEYLFTNSVQRKLGKKLPDYIKEGLVVFNILIRLTLNIRCVIRAGLDNKSLDLVLRDIFVSYSRAFINPGTAIGILMGHAIGQPMTQGMLNSISGKTKTGNISSIIDITETRKTNNLSNPFMMFEVDSPDEFAASIEMKSLSNFKYPLVMLDRPISKSHIGPDDSRLVKSFKKYSNIPNVSSICVRFELDKLEMIIKGVSIENIVISLYKHFDGFKLAKSKIDITIINSAMDDEELVILIYLKEVPRHMPILTLEMCMTAHINSCIIDGIEGITSAQVETKMYSKIGSSGEVETVEKKYVITEGINIPAVYPRIKKDTFTTNTILEVAERFGIIAAEQMIVSKLKEQAGSLDDRHIISLAHSMTQYGTPRPNTYHGIKHNHKDNVGLQIGTEHVITSLKSAVECNKKHDVYGLTAPLIVSASPKIGTNFNRITINGDFVAKNTKSAKSILSLLLKD